MTSRDKVLNAVTFQGMPYIPLMTGPDADTARIGFNAANSFNPEKDGENEWGCVWSSLNPEQGDQGQVIFHPLSDWDNSRNYRFPDPFAAGRFDEAARRIEELRENDLFIIGNLGKGPMHLLDDLRGFENYLTDLLVAPENIDFMLDGIFNFLNGILLQYASLGVDAIWLTDDQAIQSGPLFSMDIWQEKLKPHYSKLFRTAHENDCLVFMHTCGNISEHLVPLADAGVDLLDNKQPNLWIDSQSVNEVRGKISFSTCIDIQSVMQRIETTEIEAEVSRLIRRLSLPSGGFIGTRYGSLDLHLSEEKVQLMLQAFKNFSWENSCVCV